MDSNFTKLSELVDSHFTIKKVFPPTWKMWDAAQRKMLMSHSPEKGYRKLYGVDTDKGKMDLGSGQLGNLLEAVFDDGRADINGVTFLVKSNGKTGIDIRYFFSVVEDPSEPYQVEQDLGFDPNQMGF